MTRQYIYRYDPERGFEALSRGDLVGRLFSTAPWPSARCEPPDADSIGGMIPCFWRNERERRSHLSGIYFGDENITGWFTGIRSEERRVGKE